MVSSTRIVGIARKKILSCFFSWQRCTQIASHVALNEIVQSQIMFVTPQLAQTYNVIYHVISACACSLATLPHFRVPKWKPCFWGSLCSTCLEHPQLRNVSCSLSKTNRIASWKIQPLICHRKRCMPWVLWALWLTRRGWRRWTLRPQIPPTPTSSSIPRSFGSKRMKSLWGAKEMRKSSQTHAVDILKCRTWKAGGSRILWRWCCMFTAHTPQKMAKSMKWDRPSSDIWNGSPTMMILTRAGFTFAPQRSSSTQGNALAWVPLVSPGLLKILLL